MPGASPVSCVMTSWQGGSDRFRVHSCDVLDKSWDVLRTKCLHHSSSLIFSCLRLNCLKHLKPSKLGHNMAQLKHLVYFWCIRWHWAHGHILAGLGWPWGVEICWHAVGTPKAWHGNKKNWSSPRDLQYCI